MAERAGRARDQRAPRAAVIVDTSSGPVCGWDDGSVRSFRGLRYAAAPVGDLRWRAPEPPEPWTEPVDASRPGPAAPQPVPAGMAMPLGAPQGEDCLRLNVTAPAGASPGDGRPVMVWLHGGAFLLGSSSQPLYRAAALARDHDVVVVTVNYRLGVFGFCDFSWLDGGDAPFVTNPGLRDALAALRWVREEIVAFGGDPQNVTVFGESAGGGLVTALLTLPAAQGLFARAIAQSSPATSVYGPERARRSAQLVLDALGLAAGDAARLRELPTADLLAASWKVFEQVPVQTPGILPFAPTVDGELVPEHPVIAARAGRSLPVPLLIGTNRDEAALFRWMRSPIMPIGPDALAAMFGRIAQERPGLRVPAEDDVRRAYRQRRSRTRGTAVAGDLGFRMPMVWLAEAHAERAPTYVYRFDWSTPLLRLIGLGATHATELPYVWGNLVQGSKDPTFRLGGKRTGRAVSARMQARWAAFARTGVPDAPGEPVWPRYDRRRRASLRIADRETVVDDLDADIRPTWGDEVLNFR